LSLLQSDGNTAFLRAARAGHLDKVLEHLKYNIDINTSNSVSTFVNTPYGMTPKQLGIQYAGLEATTEAVYLQKKKQG
jgi:ankyrin repeat protein